MNTKRFTSSNIGTFSVVVFYLINHHVTAEDGVFSRMHGLTRSECIKVCDKRARCAAAKYTRRFPMCELYDDIFNVQTRIPGTWSYVKEQNSLDLPDFCLTCTLSEECHINNTNETCSIYGCGQPPTIPLAQTLGNIYTIGSKVKYQCLEQPSSVVELCLDDGTWSQTSLSCKCELLFIPDALSSVHPLDGGLYGADISCHSEYELQQTDPPMCDPLTGIWSNINDTYCVKVIDGPWRKVYSYPREIGGSIVGSWLRGFKHQDRYAYRNATVIDNWQSMSIREIKLTVIDNNTQAAFIMFNGQASTQDSWFHKERIIESSWLDLQESEIAYMSWYGIGKINNISINLRRYIAKTFDKNVCENNEGWFVVTWDYYPCDESDPTSSILYAKGNVSSTFLSDRIGYADYFEIWVK